MKDWLTASEIAALTLPGLPGSTRGVNLLADRERWTDRKACRRLRKGRGGAEIEYHVSLLPPGTLVSHATRQIGTVDVPDAALAEAAREPSAQALLPMALESRDARLALLAACERFTAAGALSRRTADETFAALYNGGRIDVAAWVRAAVKELSPRTLARWRAAAQSKQTNKLGVDRGAARRGRGLLDTAESGAVRTFCLALVAKQPHLSAYHIRTLVADRFPTVKLPPERTFRHALKGWKATHHVALTQITNPDAFKSKFRVSGRGTHPVSRLNELWMIDASPADMLCVDGRYSVYVAIDVFSRRLQIYVSKTARAAAVGLLMRRAILAWGMPERVKTDNGSDFTAKTTQRLFASLGIAIELATPFAPEQKGHVERAIGTMQRDLMPLLPGYIGHSVADRKIIEARKAFAQRLGETADRAFCIELTAEDVQKACDEWAATRYAHRAHDGLGGVTPFAAAGAYSGAVRRVDDTHALDMLLAPLAGRDGLRTVTKSGVRVDGLFYLAPTVLPGTDVLVRMDPADMGRAHLFGRDGATYLGEAICPQLSGVDPAAAVAQARAAQKALLEKSTSDIRKEMRAIKPRDMVDAVLRQAAKEAGTLVEFPRRSEAHTTPQIAAASVAAAPPKPATAHRETDGALLAAIEAELASPVMAPDRADNVTPLRTAETSQQRFRRALDLEQRVALKQSVSTEEALWLGGYQQTADYRAMRAVFEDFGEAALR